MSLLFIGKSYAKPRLIMLIVYIILSVSKNLRVTIKPPSTNTKTKLDLTKTKGDLSQTPQKSCKDTNYLSFNKCFEVKFRLSPLFLSSLIKWRQYVSL